MTFEELMACYWINDDFCNQKAYDLLLKQAQNDRLTLFAGAGLSIWAGYPTWAGLLREKSKGLPEERKTHAEELINQFHFEEAASELEKFYRPNTFMNIIADVFSPEKLKNTERPTYQRFLPQIFHGPLVTTNYDSALEDLFQLHDSITPNSVQQESRLGNSLQTNQRELIRLHGKAADPTTMILTAEQYKAAYGKDPDKPDLNLPLPKALAEAFRSAPPLFLGCGLGPDRTCKVLRACAGVTGFALLELPEETDNPGDPLHPRLFDNGDYQAELAKRIDHLDTLRLQVIWYPHGQHDAVRVLIERLAKDLGGIEKNEESALLPDKGNEADDYVHLHDFLGRDKIVADIAKTLCDRSVPVIWVHGGPGIGKTEICKAVYQLLQKEDPAFSMPFVDLVGVGSTAAFLGCLAAGLRLQTEGLTPDQLYKRLLSEVRRRFPDGNGLIYLDNFEDVWNGMEEAERNTLLDRMQTLTGVGLRMLCSSQIDVPFPRSRLFSVGPLDGTVCVDKLTWDELLALDRVQLFLRVLDRPVGREEREALTRLTQDLEGHPLSIVLTAAWGRGALSLEELFSTWDSIQVHIPGEKDAHKSLSRALRLAFDGIRDNRAAVFIWALHYHAIVPLDKQTLDELRVAAEEVYDEGSWREGGRRLMAAGLSYRADAGRVGMLLAAKKPFPKLNEAARQAAALALQVWINWGLCVLDKAADTKSPDHASRMARAAALLPQLIHVGKACVDQGRLEDLNRFFIYLTPLYSGYPSHCLPFLDRILADAPVNYWHRAEVLELRMALASFDDDEDNLNSAALDELQAIYSEQGDNYGLAEVLCKRAKLLQNRGSTEQAQILFRKSLEAAEKARQDYHEAGDNGNETLAIRKCAEMLGELGETDAALTALREGESFCKSVGDTDGLADMLSDRGRLLKGRGNADGALDAWRTAATLYQEQHNYVCQAHVLSNCGHLLAEREEWEGAEDCYRTALKLYRNEQHPNYVCLMLAKLYRCLCRQNREEEGKVLKKEVTALLPKLSKLFQENVKATFELAKQELEYDRLSKEYDRLSNILDSLIAMQN